mgnify:CR=1 FL=1
MADIFKYLDEASKPEFLNIVRREVKPRVPVSKNDAIVDEVMDDMGAISDDDDDIVTDSEMRKIKKPIRQQSKTMLALIHRYFPKSDIECNNDTSCFLTIIANQINKFHFKKDDDNKRLIAELRKIKTIVDVLQPVTSTAKNYYSSLTAIFKRYWIERGETNTSGKHVEAIRSVLKIDLSRSMQYIQEKEANRADRLKDRYHEKYDEVEYKTRAAYNSVMHPDVWELTTEDQAKLLISIETSCGCRMGAIGDPNIEFLTYPQWERRKKKLGVSGSFRLGTVSDVFDDDDEPSIEVDEDMFGQTIGMEYVIVQVGVLKDPSTSINSFIDEADERWVPPRVLVKPSIILTAKEIVAGVKEFRQIANITKKNFVGRERSSNIWSNKVSPVIKKMYPRAAAKSKANNWSFGSHYGRKLYANASYEIYANQLRSITSKYMDRSIWISYMLGHMGSIQTSLSYANVSVEFGIKDKNLSLPPEHQVRLLQGQIDFLMKMFTDLKKQRNEEASVDDLEQRNIVNKAEVSLYNNDNEIVTLKKHRRRNFKGDADLNKVVRDIWVLLESNNITVNNETLRHMGLGRGTIGKYLKLNNLSFQKKKKDAVAAVPEPVAPPVPEPVPKKKRKRIELPEGQKVIAKQATPSQKLKGAALEKRNREYLNRDIETFGPENVLQDESECEGDILKNQKLGPKTTRDICEE